ncbi:MAG TPA: hypothetical protein VF573_07395 [Paraburkholderia sp.]|uniref:hypothetical protein n=1 Tax=unclassified Paraburkholderia TaxID=2615204 RepID=UPI002E19C2C7|nr:hypothetical protein [Paraburkholderia sp. MPAMCS5]
MTLFFLMCFGIGLIGGIPVWIVWQYFRRRSGVRATRRFDLRHAVPFEAAALVLNGRPVPQPAAARADASEPSTGASSAP